MSIANVTSKWVDGDLVFYNTAGSEIARFDESAGTFDMAGIAIDGTTVTASAAELNLLAGAGATVASGTQAEAIANPTGGATTDAEARAAISALIAAVEAFGIVAAG